MRNRVRIGLIGAGRWGKMYLRTLQGLSDRCELTDLCTKNPASRQLVPASVTIVDDWKALIRSNCVAVIIATPPSSHAEILEACLAAAKPCIVEKPLCLDVPTAERLHQRVEQSGAPVLVDHTQLFSAAYLAMRQRLGERREPIRLIVSEGEACGPFRRHTSALWDWCPHDLSLCLDLTGEAPDHVQALGGPQGPQGDPEQVSILLRFPGGAEGWIHAGRLAAHRRRTLGVWTDRHLYVLDDRTPDAYEVASAVFATRYEGGVPDPLAFESIPVPHQRPPLADMVSYFLEGLRGGDRRLFGTKLALDVVRVLAQCEGRMAVGAERREGLSSCDTS